MTTTAAPAILPRVQPVPPGYALAIADDPTSVKDDLGRKQNRRTF